MNKGENLAWQTSSKDSVTVNSAASCSVSDSDMFCLVFYLKTLCMLYIFRWLCAPPATTKSNLCWEGTKRETHSSWLGRGYVTSILELMVGFRAVANFRFSSLVKFLFSQRLLEPTINGLGTCCKCRFKSTLGIKDIGTRAWTADWLDQAYPTARQSK